jgi:aminopeptidase 2
VCADADLQAGDFALGRVWPEYQMETRFVSHVLDTALNLDAKLSSHPIEADIPDEGKIAQVRN